MNKCSVLLLLLCISSGWMQAQILPKENTVINYRLVGFSCPKQNGVTAYRIEVASGHFDNEDSFKKNTALSAASKTNKIITEVPSFGQKYTWRVVYEKSGKLAKKSALYHFETGIIPAIDTNNTRLRVSVNLVENNDKYVFLDGARVLYDMNGNPVWFLPAKDGMQVRDMRITPQGTITYINSDKIYEINYNGDILWKGPNTGAVSGDTSEHYHHEFNRLANGDYMVLGYEKFNTEIKKTDDSTIIMDNLPYGTIIEYDKKGKIIWSWNAFSYFKNSDLRYYKKNSRERSYRQNYAINVHENAFYFDERNKVIYLGFRNISRVLKIKYPEGVVIDTYGEVYYPNEPAKGNALFCGQHSLSISQKGYLLMFNNNSCNEYGLPQLLMLQEPRHPGDSICKVWEYQCIIDSTNEKHEKQNPFSSNGDVIELPDQTLFAYMSGGIYSKLFIVNLDKAILWSASAEEWDSDNKKWKALLQYRASMITNAKDLGHLIWNQ